MMQSAVCIGSVRLSCLFNRFQNCLRRLGWGMEFMRLDDRTWWEE